MDIIATELLIATGMVMLTVLVHGAGLLGLGRLIGQGEDHRTLDPVSWRGARLATMLALGLMALHGVEIWMYALLFNGLGAIPDLREAVYFSTISYATIGDDSAAIAPDWKLLGAIEGINGQLLLGWTVAFFVTVMTRVLRFGRGDD
ncbi:ion channel [Sphingoaurantiacus capsulatus]|uniref:Ion channel n=1 Tax=Sphingoaurantiacus capsulatus TaxID=1771310 RepID=A0ABV7X4U5_9SPHN